MIRKEDAERLMVRLPREVKAWIAAEASRNGSSQNSEIIRAIRCRIDMTAMEADLVTKLESLRIAEPAV